MIFMAPSMSLAFRSGHLGLGDLPDLVAGDGTDLGLVRFAGALLQTSRLQHQLRRGRRLGDERERPVLVHGDLDRDDLARCDSVAAL